MGTQTYTVTLPFPIPIFPAGLQSALMLTNESVVNTVYVNDIPNNNGTAITSGSTLTWDKGKPLYAYVITGQPVTLIVLENDGTLTSPPIIAPGTITAAAIAAGAITTVKLAADAITGMLITGGTIVGALIKTALTGKRWEITSTPANVIAAYSGSVSETSPGGLTVDVDASGNPIVNLHPPVTGLGITADLDLWNDVSAGSGGITHATLTAEEGQAGPFTWNLNGPSVVGSIRANFTGPATQQDCVAAFKDLDVITVNIDAGHGYKLTGFANGSQITAAGITRSQIVDDQGGQAWIAYATTLAIGAVQLGTGVLFLTATTTRTATFKIQGASSAGAYRVAANACKLTVEAL